MAGVRTTYRALIRESRLHWSAACRSERRWRRDLIASKLGRRWLFQVKRWGSRVGPAVIDKTLTALTAYKADIPVVVSLGGFESRVYEQQKRLMAAGLPLQLWDRERLLSFGQGLQPTLFGQFQLRKYQQQAVDAITTSFESGFFRHGMFVLATGLGKTFVAAESFRLLSSRSLKFRALIIAHTNDLVYQLERAFWPMLRIDQDTSVWNGIERPLSERLNTSTLIFACLSSLYESVDNLSDIVPFDLVIVDECHHVGGHMYGAVLDAFRAGQEAGPYLLGMTATPWRADGFPLQSVFGEPLISIDLVSGLRQGFLTNVDYRMYTDNIDWSKLGSLSAGRHSPRAINRTLFIEQWDDGVVDALQQAWDEVPGSRALVFCGTIDHAVMMRDKVNARRFCQAEALFSVDKSGRRLTPVLRNRILSDFSDGRLDVLCVVDIFNEGIDVPDVNILVFQRVTHSRRIFIQQLGRGLRLSDRKDKVIVLDFVSDIRRFAAGLDLQRRLSDEAPSRDPVRLRLPGTLEFRRVGGSDPRAETFLKQWLDDVAAIEDAGEDASVLKYPPAFAS